MSRTRIRPIDIMTILAIVGFCGWKMANHASGQRTERSAFAKQVQLNPLNGIAIQADGRLRSFESFARTYLRYISGPRTIRGQSNGFSYLDLMIRPEKYADVDMIYVKNKNVRKQILDAIGTEAELDGRRSATILRTGLMSRALLDRPVVTTLLHRLGSDLIRTSKDVDAISSALAVSDARFLANQFRSVPPPNGDPHAPWLTPADVMGRQGMPQDNAHAELARPEPIQDLDPKVQQGIAEAWTTLATAWRQGDAAAVNAQLKRLAELFPEASPNVYPSQSRLAMESWYFRNKSMTWVWLLYLASVMPLLMSTVYQWDRARTIGMALFVLAFLAHSASVGIRWHISGRWPNANMFEAVTTAAWMGGVAALIIEYLVRRSAFRNLFALGSAVVSMAALMAAYFLPAQLDSGINNKMAALNDVWLYIHTNVIICSYAVIGLACVPALLYLRHRWCTLWDDGVAGKANLLVLPIALVVVNYTGYRLLMHLIANPTLGLHGTTLYAVCGAFWASLMVVVSELFGARARRASGVAMAPAASGGASSLIRRSPRESGFLTRPAPAAAQVYDGATMVLVELSFVMLWTGVVMGAIWADHSWGRPWGWDPKEVFALNTFIIFLILIHVRLKVRDKGFWTAVLAIVGFEVMMFNWIVVNFIITGLHSYA